jgi:L-fucose isomerase-like protein
MNKPIFKLKNININAMKQECSLDKWFIEILQKKVSELNLLDVSRMLRQEIYPDIAVPLTWKILKENPFEGEMYDGQLLELLVRYLMNNQEQKDEISYINFKDTLYDKINKYEWETQDDINSYKVLLDKLDLIFKNKD